MNRPKLQSLKPRIAAIDLRQVQAIGDLAGRSTKAKRVYESRRWREKTRPEKLTRDPLCQRHKYLGMIVMAEHVDHWLRIADGGAEHADDNLVSLCRDCHIEKTVCERTGQPFPEIAPSTTRTYAIA